MSFDFLECMLIWNALVNKMMLFLIFRVPFVMLNKRRIHLVHSLRSSYSLHFTFLHFILNTCFIDFFLNCLILHFLSPLRNAFGSCRGTLDFIVWKKYHSFIWLLPLGRKNFILEILKSFIQNWGDSLAEYCSSREFVWGKGI